MQSCDTILVANPYLIDLHVSTPGHLNVTNLLKEYDRGKKKDNLEKLKEKIENEFDYSQMQWWKSTRMIYCNLGVFYHDDNLLKALLKWYITMNQQNKIDVLGKCIDFLKQKYKQDIENDFSKPRP